MILSPKETFCIPFDTWSNSSGRELRNLDSANGQPARNGFLTFHHGLIYKKYTRFYPVNIINDSKLSNDYYFMRHNLSTIKIEWLFQGKC